MSLDLPHLQTWLGRQECLHDTLTPTPVAALSATLSRNTPRPRPGDPVPPLWHWLYFLPLTHHTDLGPDGHARRGGFLPPVPLPRRMWAGGRLEFRRPLRIGEPVERLSTIRDVSHKSGRSGDLVFVVVRHEVSDRDGLAIVEEQDIVYRDLPSPGLPTAPAQPAPGDGRWSMEITPDPVLLFRYSALTFNGHRIHYDRDYATDVEGYPGLVVHGPLQATLLLELLRRELPDAHVAGFQFRALRPVFDTAPFRVCGKPLDDARVQLWVADPDGALAMEATATLNND